MEPVDVLDRPHREARALLATGAPAYVFVNPVEYHGPHLSLHNDALVSRGIARELHARLAAREPAWPFLVASDLELGVDPTRGAGTRATPYPVARALVRQACDALADLGARRVVILTFHGAPLHNLALHDAARALARRGVAAVAPFSAVLREMIDVDPARYAGAYAHVRDRAEREAMNRAMRLDFHAGFFETSVALHYAPESVSPAYTRVPPCPAWSPDPALARAASVARALGRGPLARELEFAAQGQGWLAMDPFPGYTGAPHHATPAAGAFFATRLVDLYERLVGDVFAGRAETPAPIMPWLPWATLGGRIAPRGGPAVDVSGGWTPGGAPGRCETPPGELPTAPTLR